MSTESYRFKVGTFGCIAANDFTSTYAAHASDAETTAPTSAKAGVVLRWGVASAFSCPPLPAGSGRWASQRNDE